MGAWQKKKKSASEKMEKDTEREQWDEIQEQTVKETLWNCKSNWNDMGFGSYLQILTEHLHADATVCLKKPKISHMAFAVQDPKDFSVQV